MKKGIFPGLLLLLFITPFRFFGYNHPLFNAIIDDNTNKVMNYIKKGVNTNTISIGLYVASEFGNITIMKILIDAGADVNIKIKITNLNKVDSSPDTPLMEAAARGYSSVVKMLIDYKADVNSRAHLGYTSLIIALCSSKNKAERSEIVKLLIGAKADVNARTDQGLTALIAASSFGNTEAVKLLISAGADVNAKTYDGTSALILTRKHGFPEIENLLLNAGANN